MSSMCVEKSAKRRRWSREKGARGDGGAAASDVIFVSSSGGGVEAAKDLSAENCV